MVAEMGQVSPFNFSLTLLDQFNIFRLKFNSDGETLETPAHKERCTASGERIKDRIASLTKSRYQVLCKRGRKGGRMINIPTIAADVGYKNIRNP